MNSAEAFEEVCKTVDVSRDGLLFIGRHKGYEKGQLLGVTFPYSNQPGSQNHPQQAEVVRVVAQPHGKAAIAVHFLGTFKVTYAAEPKLVEGRATDRRGEVTHYVSGATTNEPVKERQPPVILAVEPNRGMAAMMRSMLEKEGYLLVVVNTGKEAAEFLETNVPDVLVSEFELPDTSGPELCRTIRQDERLARIPLILVSKKWSAEQNAEAESLGAVVCIAKQFQLERLHQRIRVVAPPPATRFYETNAAEQVVTFRNEVV